MLPLQSPKTFLFIGKRKADSLLNIKKRFICQLTCSVLKEATVTTDDQEKALGVVLSKGYRVIYVSRKFSKLKETTVLERELWQ